MAIDLKTLNQNQLNELIQRAEQRKNELSTERATKLREKLSKMAEVEGFNIAELFGLRSGNKTKVGKNRRVAKPKYRNPSDTSQIWSGRGKRPRWFNAALAAGKKEKDLLIG